MIVELMDALSHHLGLLQTDGETEDTAGCGKAIQELLSIFSLCVVIAASSAKKISLICTSVSVRNLERLKRSPSGLVPGRCPLWPFQRRT